MDIQVGDQVLVKQDKTMTRPPFDPDPYRVTEVKGTQMTGKKNESGEDEEAGAQTIKNLDTL